MKYVYEVRPIDLLSLPEERQMSIVTSRFLALLNWLDGPMSIYMVKDHLSIATRELRATLPVMRTFLESHEPMEHVLDSLGYEYSRILDRGLLNISLRHRRLTEGLNHIIINNNDDDEEEGDSPRYARCFILYRLPTNANIAWIYGIARLADETIIDVMPLRHDAALSKMKRYTSLMKAASMKYSSLAYKAGIAEMTLQALEKHETKLFRVCIIPVIKARSTRELNEKSRRFVRDVKHHASLDPVMGRQLDLLMGNIRSVIVELGSMSILYPFVSSDMLEVPNGIVLGINLNTDAPVIYDYSLRDNYNVIILASSGAGKSMTAKIMLNRLLEKIPDSYAFIIDPQGEYAKIADYMSADTIDVVNNRDIGLDPLKLFDAVTAGDVIADITMAPLLVRKEIAVNAGKVDSIFSLYNMLSDRAKPYLMDVVNNHANVFRGDARMGRRSVLMLKGISSTNGLSMLLLLSLAKVWNEINSLKDNTLKILLVDEGWMLFNIPSAARFVNLIARVGRKLNVLFIFITQRPEDVIANEYGRALLDNADTKVLLRNNELAAMKIAEALQLSSKEREMLTTFNRGEALLLTKGHRIRLQMVAGEKEMRLFSTDPNQ
ncbi:MAG: ATP-binding protein [Candidatus Nitrosocaldus sp.]|nr:ATP-binding protein [Candidatus Nitrosocaldus sp.]MDW8000528.1 ATP-binding protein [Candidatus Nitrosocaldus sp.]